MIGRSSLFIASSIVAVGQSRNYNRTMNDKVYGTVTRQLANMEVDAVGSPEDVAPGRARYPRTIWRA